MFKPNPKALVSSKFAELFGKNLKHEVRGVRQGGMYYVEIVCEDEVVASAKSKDWREAYRLLKGVVESLHAEGWVLS